MIYFDNAATTKPSESAVKKMNEILLNDYGNPSSLYNFGQKSKELLEENREIIANYLNANTNEIFFTSGGSESDNQALISAAEIGKKKNKKHIISSKIEHHAILHTLKKLEKDGFEITLLNVDKNGFIDLNELERTIRTDTILVSIMFANNEIGTIEPIEEIGKICEEKGVIFHTDAVQAAGHIPIDVKKMHIDMLSISGHKFHGPKGIGVLYCKKGISLTSLINGGSQERGKRAGTENLASIAGMAIAFKESCDKMEHNSKKIIFLRNKLISELSKIPHSKINGDLDLRVPNNVNICFEGIEGESLLLLLDEKGICASSGSACTSGSLDPSHVLLALGIPHEVAHGSLRLSLSEINTEEEVDYCIKVLPQIVNYLRDISPVWEELEKGERKHVI